MPESTIRLVRNAKWTAKVKLIWPTGHFAEPPIFESIKNIIGRTLYKSSIFNLLLANVCASRLLGVIYISLISSQRYHKAVRNVTPDDVYFGWREQILAGRAESKQKTLLERKESNNKWQAELKSSHNSKSFLSLFCWRHIPPAHLPKLLEH